MSRGDLQQFQHYWLPLAIIGGLVVLTAWLGQLADRRPTAQAGAKPGHNPDYFVDSLHAVAFDVAGVPRYHLSASRMVHFMDDDTTTLESPHFLRDGPGVVRVEAQARRGLVSANGEIVTLLDDVQMKQDSESGGPPLEMTTNYLKILPNADRLSSDRPVILRQGKSEVTGNSMQADGKARTFEMDGRVKGTYEVQH